MGIMEMFGRTNKPENAKETKKINLNDPGVEQSEVMDAWQAQLEKKEKEKNANQNEGVGQ